eukprot:5523556-Alexandrium_andersonii.AAC.1
MCIRDSHIERHEPWAKVERKPAGHNRVFFRQRTRQPLLVKPWTLPTCSKSQQWEVIPEPRLVMEPLA